VLFVTEALQFTPNARAFLWGPNHPPIFRAHLPIRQCQYCPHLADYIRSAHYIQCQLDNA